MSQSKDGKDPWIDTQDAVVLGGIMNRMAKSFDVAALSVQEALVLYMVLDRAMSALWNCYEKELMQVLLRSLKAMDDEDQEDEEPTGSN